MQAQIGANCDLGLHNSREQHSGRFPMSDLLGDSQRLRGPGAMWTQLVCHLPLSPLRLTPSGWAFSTALPSFLGVRACILCVTVNDERDQISLCKYL